MNENIRSLADQEDAYRRIARYVSIALILGEQESWLQLKILFKGYLSPQERAALAFAAMRSLSEDDRVQVAAHTIPEWAECGSPLPTLFDLADEAKWWASNASPKELETYLLCCFNELDRHRQIEFSGYLQTRCAA